MYMNTTKPDLSKPSTNFAHRLLDWYDAHARMMPWRISPEQFAAGKRPAPYHIWLSEIMLQQTQVATVRDYFLKFVSTWPYLEDLAAAELEDVLKAWAGLGYYSRARNLKRCADILVSEYNGRFPETYDELKSLPGIGDYTAAAIASIAFNQPVPVVDGNVERVMSRHRRITTPFPKAKTETKKLVAEILDQQRPGEFAQATMDLGATLCTPKKPSCLLCPINDDCLAYEAGDADRFPVKLPKVEKPTRKGAAFVLRNAKGDVYLCKRADSGLLAGMSQVPTTDWTARQDGATGTSAAPIDADWRKKGKATHTFTHFHLELEVWEAVIDEKPDFDGWWCRVSQLKAEAIPKVMHRVLAVVV